MMTKPVRQRPCDGRVCHISGAVESISLLVRHGGSQARHRRPRAYVPGSFDDVVLAFDLRRLSDED